MTPHNKHILIGIGGVMLLIGGVWVYFHYFASVPGTTLTRAQVTGEILAEKLKEDQAWAVANSLTPAVFDAAPAYWKSDIMQYCGVPGIALTTTAASLSPAQWAQVQASIPATQNKISGSIQFTQLIHSYPDFLATALSKITGVQDQPTACAWILKNM